MTHNQDAAAAAATVADEARAALLADLLGQVAGCFPRRETRRSCGQMVGGLLMELEDHNCWTLAEAIGHRGPHQLQHLLSRAVWDGQRMLDIAAGWAVSHLDDGDAVLIVDETADEKSSTDAAGAARQYLLDRTHSAGIRAAFVAGDEVYGGRQLRQRIRERGMGYVLAVRSNHTITAGAGRTLTAAGAVRLIPARAWHRMRTGSGTKGTRHYDWAMLEVTSDDTPGGHDGGHSVLPVRRHRYTRQLSFYRCWTPGPVPLARLIAIAVTRWRIEEDHQLARQATGLDAGQVIRWRSWHRWTAICLLAYLYLATTAIQRQHDATSDLDAGLIPITTPELLRLLRGTVIPPPRRDRTHRLHRSAWRRRHQYRARQAHQRWHAYAEKTP